MFEGVELGQKVSKAKYEVEMPRLREALLEIQSRLQESDRSVVVVIAGAEGAGKGEVVNTLVEWMDARGITVHGVGAPTREESERPDFYRFWRRLPLRGAMAVFFGSWYTRPIVERSFDQIDEHDMEDALRRITNFERMLVDENIVLVKFWLHITKDLQARRFKKLEADPDTAWRVSQRDWEYHESYDQFVVSSSLALRRTNTHFAPWHLIDAANRRFRNISVGQRLLDAIGQALDAPISVGETKQLPKPPEVNVLNQLDFDVALDRENYRKLLAQHQGKVARLARRLGATGHSAVIVFEGADAAGKGGCIRRIANVLDARFYRVIPIVAPSDEERARPYLWRFWRRLPRKGEIVIFDRSWYGRVLVERIEGFCPAEAWQRAYSEINDFEEQLFAADILVFKFWLAITPQEQLARFEHRKVTGYKRYKLTSEDWRNRDRWAAYEAAACDMFEKTSTEIAPWVTLAANDKLYARTEVLKSLGSGLERMLGPDEKPKAQKKRKHRH